MTSQITPWFYIAKSHWARIMTFWKRSMSLPDNQMYAQSLRSVRLLTSSESSPIVIHRWSLQYHPTWSWLLWQLNTVPTCHLTTYSLHSFNRCGKYYSQVRHSLSSSIISILFPSVSWPTNFKPFSSKQWVSSGFTWNIENNNNCSSIYFLI